jgi:hypothetical protein
MTKIKEDELIQTQRRTVQSRNVCYSIRQGCTPASLDQPIHQSETIKLVHDACVLEEFGLVNSNGPNGTPTHFSSFRYYRQHEEYPNPK